MITNSRYPRCLVGGLREVGRQPGSRPGRLPGWGGQQFIPASIDKIRRLRALVGPDVELEVDGGIDEHTAGPCAEAGATLFVAGTSVFGTEDPGAAFRKVAAAAGCS